MKEEMCEECGGNGDSGAPCEIKCEACDGSGFVEYGESNGAYILLNETESNECVYILGAFAGKDNAITAAQNIDPSLVDYIDDKLTINVRYFDGLETFENSKTVFSIEWRTQYNEDLDDYEWVKL